MIDLSIVVVNSNSTAYLLKCLKSIYQHTHEATFEIVVIDNASSDGDIAVVRQQYPNVRVLENEINLGFARANNLGFRVTVGEYVLFLNPDTILLNAALDLMLRRIRTLPSAGAVGCTLLNEDLSIQTSAIQTFPTIFNQMLDLDVLRNRFPACRLWNFAPLLTGGTEPSSVEVISGACMMFKRNTLAQIGLFSEEYFMYAEDLDLCYRAAQAKLVNYYIPQAQIVHYGGKSSVYKSAVVLKWTSILHYIERFHGYRYKMAFRSVIAASALLRLAVLLIAVSLSGKDRRHNRYIAIQKWWLILSTMASLTERKPKPLDQKTVKEGTH